MLMLMLMLISSCEPGFILYLTGALVAKSNISSQTFAIEFCDKPISSRNLVQFNMKFIIKIGEFCIGGKIVSTSYMSKIVGRSQSIK
jgi:hypothetical protein